MSLDSTPPTRDQPDAVEHLEDQRRTRFWITTIAIGASVLLLVGVLVGILRDDDPSEVGIELAQPVTMPDVTLTDTEGEPYDLAANADGRVTLLYFGYLACPDACPIHMAVLGKVFDSLPGDIRDDVDVVFVTTDPERDGPDELRAYLDRFDPAFIGLTGDPELLGDAQIAAGVPVAVAEPADEDGNYLVGHATQVLVFGRDGVARVVYPFGVRQADWMQDLPQLVDEHRT